MISNLQKNFNIFAGYAVFNSSRHCGDKTAKKCSTYSQKQAFETSRIDCKSHISFNSLNFIKNRPKFRFLESFRTDKEMFETILNKISPFMKHPQIRKSIQLGAALRFLATGSYQLGVAKDHDINIGRSTFSKVLHNVVNHMEEQLCYEAIQLQMRPNEIAKSKEYFYENFSLPGVIACVDGTHVKILKPVVDESVFLNRKGYYSLNAMIVLIPTIYSFHPILKSLACRSATTIWRS